LGGLHFQIPDRWVTSFIGWPGQLSYGMYLLHSGVLFLSRPWLGASNPWVDYALFSAATVSIAALCFYGSEKPMNRAIRNWFLDENTVEKLARQKISQTKASA